MDYVNLLPELIGDDDKQELPSSDTG